MTTYNIIAIILLSIDVLFLIIFFIYKIYQHRCIVFLNSHSNALYALDGLNRIYRFRTIKSFDMNCSYVDETSFNSVDPKDYLIHQLSEYKESMLKTLKDVSINKELYERYLEEINERCHIGEYGKDIKTPINKKSLLKIEKKLLILNIVKPITSLTITVTLTYGKKKKTSVFSEEQIVELINDIK